MAIQKIKIRNFKCFKGLFEIELNKGLNILVGNNETGKSTILEAIHIALTGLYGGRNSGDGRNHRYADILSGYPVASLAPQRRIAIKTPPDPFVLHLICSILLLERQAS